MAARQRNNCLAALSAGTIGSSRFATASGPEAGEGWDEDEAQTRPGLAGRLVLLPWVDLDFKTEIGVSGRRLPLRMIRHCSTLPSTAIHATRDMLDQLGYADCKLG